MVGFAHMVSTSHERRPRFRRGRRRTPEDCTPPSDASLTGRGSRAAAPREEEIWVRPQCALVRVVADGLRLPARSLLVARVFADQIPVKPDGGRRGRRVRVPCTSGSRGYWTDGLRQTVTLGRVAVPGRCRRWFSKWSSWLTAIRDQFADLLDGDRGEEADAPRVATMLGAQEVARKDERPMEVAMQASRASRWSANSPTLKVVRSWRRVIGTSGPWDLRLLSSQECPIRYPRRPSS